MIRILRAASVLFVATLTLHFGPLARAVENTWDYSVQVSSSVQASPASITLSWPQDTNGVPASYTVYRKAPGDSAWGNGAALAGSATSYTDTSVSVGTTYEYRIVKAAGSYTGYGYIQTGIQAALADSRGKVVLIVDNTFASSLAGELARLQQDLAGDGWTVLRHDVARTESVASVKNLIKSDYYADPANVKSVFLFGHIAVPYSGQFNPDGHPDHVGAWPADVYYGDVDGNWTDATVNYTQSINSDPADAARLSNRPGDGKFDQNDIPSAVELQVGRVDLANMPGRTTWGGPATFASETELLRNYLNKDHNFRHRVSNPARRALLGDYFGARGGEAFAASGFRAFAPLVGPANIRNLNLEFGDQKGVWIPQAAQQDYLFAYGCGAGSYATMAGLGSSGNYNDGSTTELVSANTRGVFNLLFGSWMGDWDHEDNFLRAPLATSSGLVSVWSGRPHWFIHALGLGETIGYTAQVTQNNSGLYETQINASAHRTHIALMGDPTLRLHPVVPAGNLGGSVAGGTVNLAWSASADSAVVGYHVYRGASANGPFTRLTSTPTTATSFSAGNSPGGASYMVRAVKLETTPSGSYYNASQGVFWNATDGGAVAAQPAVPTSPSPIVTTPSPPATGKVTGAAREIGSNIVAANGSTYDQVLLEGASATVTADAGQVTRTSFLDLNGDIVQVEFSGAGTLAITLDQPSGPMAAANYNQPAVAYMRGHASLRISGANETTNISVFSVGTLTAANVALFRGDINYDGVADIGSITIENGNGKFGGVRAANASFFATGGRTGIYAPGVQFTGPVVVHDIAAVDGAVPSLVLGAIDTVRVAGGSLAQPNGRAVDVSGIAEIRFTDGTTSFGRLMAAQDLQGNLYQVAAGVLPRISR